MKLALKTRDNLRENYLYEVHLAGCSHLEKEVCGKAFITDEYQSPEDFIKVDMGKDLARDDYKIMPCCNKSNVPSLQNQRTNRLSF